TTADRGRYSRVWSHLALHARAKTILIPTVFIMTSKFAIPLLFSTIILFTGIARGEEKSFPQTTPQVRKPTGEAVRVAVTRDTWFSNVGKETDGNNGGARQLKLKSNQEMSLIDIDAKPLRGRVIQGATLHVRLSSSEPLHRVTVGSFGADWVEGTSSSYAPQKGS